MAAPSRHWLHLATSKVTKFWAAGILFVRNILFLFHGTNRGSVQNLSHIGSGDGSGLHDLRLVEGSHVHVALRRPSRCCDVAEPGCSEIET